MIRRALKEAEVEIPQALEGLVEESQLLVRIEDDDRRVDLVKRFRMDLDHPLMFGAHRLDVTDIARKA